MNEHLALPWKYTDKHNLILQEVTAVSDVFESMKYVFWSIFQLTWF